MLTEILTNLASLSTVLGIPLAILLFLNEKRKERIEREYGTYDALDEKYREFLLLCMDHPELNLYSIPLKKEKKLTAGQTIQQLAMFEILVSLLERAFLMYKDQNSHMKKNQWAGWVCYIEDWSRHPVFAALWPDNSDQFDKEFIAYMNALMAR